MIELFEKVFKGTKQELMQQLIKALEEQRTQFVVTANPEIFSKSQQDKQVQALLLDSNTCITPDGEGIVKGAKMLGMPVHEKIAGVEMVHDLLTYCANHNKKIYFYGSKEDVLQALQAKLKKQFPDISICGLKNGYDFSGEDVFLDMQQQQPDLILVALGVPRQEKFIYEHLSAFHKGIFVGVGGSLDVLSGTKKRAPKILIKCKMEWAYRLMKEPSRIKKFCNTHVTFIFKIRKLAKGR